MEVNIRNKFGWNFYKIDFIELWFSGYLTCGKSVENILSEAVDIYNADSVNMQYLSKWVREFSGHFAFVLRFSNKLCFVSVDKICSIPIYIAHADNRYVVSNYAPYLKDMLKINKVSINSVLEIAMSGFVLGNKTIYKDIKRLSAGECALWLNGRIFKDYYYTYFPQNSLLHNNIKLKNEFKKVCLITIKKLIRSVNGRQIVVPLSAGNDSRLIASCLKKLSYTNVICFTYGRRGNYEVNTSKKVAKILGYKWIYVQDTVRKKREFFKSKIYDDYVKTFESYASVPNIQDIYEIYTLKSMDIIDHDAVIVNGNSGDFISGGHISKKLELNKNFSLDNDDNWELFLEKHYSIWGKMRTNLNDKIISSELSKIALERFQLKRQDVFLSYSILEGMEYIGRQSRLVMNQQRAYDFIGHEWRLPLWSEDFLDFWEKVPAKYKVEQVLYKSVLIENNWGGVWNGIDVNNKLIRPYSLRMARLFVKILAAPFGKKFWHYIEKKIFVYWLHASYARTITSYWSVLFDTRGQRNTNSWTADQFIKRNGFGNGVIDVSDKISNQLLKDCTSKKN
jgi:asparagine synthase (glutamine-hydrolysing)